MEMQGKWELRVWRSVYHRSSSIVFIVHILSSVTQAELHLMWCNLC